MLHAPLIIDVAGTTLSSLDRRRLKNSQVGGVILFTRNWASREQLVALVAAIKSVRPDLLVSVDHEGGRVQRFREGGFTPLPAMAALGRLWMRDPMGAVQSAAACGYVMGAELRACGVDLSFAPVLDLDWGRSGVMATRALHADARVTSLLAQSLIGGMQRAGLAHCAKHFPGHGWAGADSHVDTPRDTRGLRTILRHDAAPYGWLRHGLQAVMPAHVVYPKVDDLPAGFSARWLQDILRCRLGFTGAIISDDLSMQGARAQARNDTSAALMALQAGCDLVMLCNQSVVDKGAAIDAVLHGLEQAVISGVWHPDPDSAQRRLALLATRPPLPWDVLVRTSAYTGALDDLARV
ncbi:beta-N-acetylhexosaminidase [Thiomonas sp. FB-Cd]|uniref:beta-N-acetylhexosaminidase n=1 Tax=Thiomonas sp. FB-Cd TaxID=1158292 RepID=UPI0004DF4EEC|nr:beta-N-acetylhexosaminidase [Thiomonas sp. FB-Cd]